ncbi:MFS transporter [Paenibacillus polymyxa]|uniref:MFS transporter n=1 Tax=Paenibacillus polymyxa TaxID=1406 RepID=UPI00083E08F5|nr:MFS transporter [Paenibacillus polymyxa]APQ59601.1 MFS transporter [Paenibacillus polymyxa]ODB59982.1 MFS transporter [Paenibacillus polymyxa]VUG07383.1 Purine efflux pump PbuE [Paenibacillus polymyxa]
MNKIITLFFFIMFFIGTDTFIVSPLLPILRESFGISIEQSGWIVSAYALGYAVFALIAGPLSDEWNRKKVLLFGLLGFGIFTLLCGFATDFWTMFAFRLLAGISAAFASPQVWAAIPQLVQPHKVLKAMGVATAGLAVSQMLGVPIGSYLATTGWQTPFIMIGCCTFLIVILTAVLLPSLPASLQKHKASSIGSRYRSLLRGSTPKIAFLAYLLFQLGNFAAFSFIGTWLSDKFSLNVGSIGTVILFLGLGNTISSLFGSSLVNKVGARHSLKYGIIFIGLLYLLLPYLPSVTYVEITYFLIFLILGMIFPLMMSLLQTLSATARGTISSLANSSMYCGTAVGSFTAGMLYAHSGGFISVSLFTVICFSMSLILFLRSGVLNINMSQSL